MYHFVRRNLTLNLFEAWVAFSALLAGILYFAQPNSLNRSALGQEVGYHLALVWSIMYAAAGSAILYGLLRASPRIEVVGLIILGTATAITGIAVTTVFGWLGIGSITTSLTLTAAAWARAVIVWRRVQILARELGDGQ